MYQERPPSSGIEVVYLIHQSRYDERTDQIHTIPIQNKGIFANKLAAHQVAARLNTRQAEQEPDSDWYFECLAYLVWALEDLRIDIM